MSLRFAFVVVIAAWFGGAAWASEDFAQVEQIMRAQLKRSPGDIDSRFRLAQSLSWQKRYAEATIEYSKLLKRKPDNADFLLGQAQVYLWSGEAAKALPLLRKARRIAPSYEEIWKVQIQASVAVGNAEHIRQARMIRDQAQQRFPKSEWKFSQLDGTTEVPTAQAPAPVAIKGITASPPPAVAVPAPRIDSTLVPDTTLSPAAGRFNVEAGFSSEALTAGLATWSSRYLVGQWRTPDKASIYGGFRTAERYALEDREFHLGGVIPLTPSLQLQLEGGLSDTHLVLPERYGSMQLQIQPALGWTVGTGYRRSFFATGQSKVSHASVDRYVGNDQFGYTLYLGGPDGSGLAPSHRVLWSHYYADRDYFSIALSRGKETENTGVNGFITSAVSGATLSGRQSLSPEWALAWELTTQRQGSLYARSGFRLGLRYGF